MSDSSPPLAGVLPVFQTPYRADESIDFECVVAHYRIGGQTDEEDDRKRFEREIVF